MHWALIRIATNPPLKPIPVSMTAITVLMSALTGRDRRNLPAVVPARSIGNGGYIMFSG